MCLCFCFVWACGFCLSFLCAMCSLSIVLTPPILFPDYWLICPTCLASITSSFAPFTISLCCSPVPVRHRFTIDVILVVSCHVLSALSCPALPCPAFPSLASFHGFPLRGSFLLFVCFCFMLFNKAHFPALVSPRLIHSPNPDTSTWIMYKKQS